MKKSTLSNIHIKRKMQDVHFENVQAFLDYLPEEELRMVEKIRHLVLQALPDCTERLAYNVPYYKRHSNICFIWPGSISWGNVKQKGVRLGFTNGHLLEDANNYLDKGDRKQVYWKDFFTLSEIEADRILAYIYEAAIVDETLHEQKNKKTNSSVSRRKKT